LGLLSTIGGGENEGEECEEVVGSLRTGRSPPVQIAMKSLYASFCDFNVQSFFFIPDAAALLSHSSQLFDELLGDNAGCGER
jgi:hypothetical protein